MIKKLNAHLYKDTTDMFEDFREKINELVDVVNALIKENNIHEMQIDELQMKLEPEKCRPIDPYAEQRKWIGKLCWFWDDEDEKDGFISKWYGTLDDIDPHCKCGVYCMGLGHYEHCEPVKPDDNIIYKEKYDDKTI